MTDRPDHAARRDRLRDRVQAAELPALLVTNPTNVRYLTGLQASNATLLIAADRERELLATDGRYAERARTGVSDLDLVITRADDWLPPRVAGLDALGVESDTLSWDRARELAALLDDVEVVPAAGHVEALRQIKDDGEIEQLRRACAITVDAVAAMIEWAEPGRSERDLARRLREEMLDRGADDAGYDFIIASGPNAARPHHRAGSRVIRRGDILQLDVGARVGGYHADMSRAFAIGDVGERLREAHDLVARAQREGRAAVAEGSNAGDVDAACRDVITEAGHAERFLHSAGHGVGLDLHEEPVLRSGSTATLRSRMTVTVEPGVYLTGAGGVRIEDVVVVTGSGCEVLTNAPRELLPV